MLSEQVLVSSGALFVRAAEGAAAAGFIFNVLLIARAPLVLFQAVAASLLPHLTRLRARGDETSEEAFRASLANTMLLIAAFAGTVTVGVLAIGPQVMQIAFGDQFEYDRLGLAIVSVGMGFYLVAASLNQAVLAQGQARRAALPWVASALAFVVYNLISPGGDPFRAVEVGFAGVRRPALGAALLRLRPPASERRRLDRAGLGSRGRGPARRDRRDRLTRWRPGQVPDVVAPPPGNRRFPLIDGMRAIAVALRRRLPRRVLRGRRRGRPPSASSCTSTSASRSSS